MKETEEFDLLGFVEAHPSIEGAPGLLDFVEDRPAGLLDFGEDRPADAEKPGLLDFIETRPRAAEKRPDVEERVGERVGALPTSFPAAEAAAAVESPADDQGCPCRKFEEGPADSDYVVVIGGAERVIGGWCDYELAARRARRTVQKCPCDAIKQDYPDRSYVTGEDVLRSLLVRGGTSIKRSVASFADSVGRFEDVLGGPDPIQILGTPQLSLPLFSADDVRGTFETSELKDLADEVDLFVGGAEPTSGPDLPPLPKRTIRIDDVAAVRRLENAVMPRARAEERARAEYAARIEEGGRALDQRVAVVGL